LGGCGSKAVLPEKPRGPLVLEYRMPEGLTLNYENMEYSTQKLDVRGMGATAVSRKSMAFSIECKGLKEDNHCMTVTVEKMDASIKTPIGLYAADVQRVIESPSI
jgi:hypothetical protein